MVSSTRAEARARGEPRYFTGKPCKHGHVVERTMQGCCTVCLAAHRADWRIRNRPRELIVNQKWRRNNRGKHREMIADWNAAHPGARASHCRARQARKKNATPKWLTPEQWAQIKEFYKIAALTGQHVDHEIPLDGRKVCGLHVPWNLRVIPATENLKKGARYAD